MKKDRFLFLYNPLRTAFRQNQEETIDKLIDFMEDDSKRYFLCEAPTGSGKSLIALTLSRYLCVKGVLICFTYHTTPLFLKRLFLF